MLSDAATTSPAEAYVMALVLLAGILAALWRLARAPAALGRVGRGR